MLFIFKYVHLKVTLRAEGYNKCGVLVGPVALLLILSPAGLTKEIESNCLEKFLIDFTGALMRLTPLTVLSAAQTRRHHISLASRGRQPCAAEIRDVACSCALSAPDYPKYSVWPCLWHWKLKPQTRTFWKMFDGVRKQSCCSSAAGARHTKGPWDSGLCGDFSLVLNILCWPEWKLSVVWKIICLHLPSQYLCFLPSSLGKERCWKIAFPPVIWILG